jgi:hypothetical protein
MMRGRSRRGRGLALVLALLITAPASIASATDVPLLRYANTGARDAYTLELAKTCEVGDGLAVVRNDGRTPLRLTSITVLYGDGATASQANTTYTLRSFRRGTNDGQLGATFDLTSLKGGVKLGNAVGGVVAPVATSGRWYDIVAKILVTAVHPTSWKISGLRVTYDMDGTSHSTVLAQSITLSATPDC